MGSSLDLPSKHLLKRGEIEAGATASWKSKRWGERFGEEEEEDGLEKGANPGQRCKSGLQM